jgi:hypothetical protein
MYAAKHPADHLDRAPQQERPAATAGIEESHADLESEAENE